MSKTVKIEEIKLAVSPITGEVYAGKVNKKQTEWLGKKDVSNQFWICVYELLKNSDREITIDNKKHRISMKERK